MRTALRLTAALTAADTGLITRLAIGIKPLWFLAHIAIVLATAIALSEYVIIGTLASFGFALLSAFATLALLQTLPPLGIPAFPP